MGRLTRRAPISDPLAHGRNSLSAPFHFPNLFTFSLKQRFHFVRFSTLWRKQLSWLFVLFRHHLTICAADPERSDLTTDWRCHRKILVQKRTR
jgi:hypothetical protein